MRGRSRSRSPPARLSRFGPTIFPLPLSPQRLSRFSQPLAVPTSPATLTVTFSRCVSIDQLLAFASIYTHDLNAIHEAAICTAAGKLARETASARSAAASLWEEYAIRWLQRPPGDLGRGARQVVNILNAAAWINVISNNELIWLLIMIAIRLSNEMNVQESANVLWAIASLAKTEEFYSENTTITDRYTILLPLLKTAANYSEQFTSQHAAVLIWASARLGFSKTMQEVITLFFAAIRLAPCFTAEEISMVCWAIGRLQFATPDSIPLFITASSLASSKNLSIQNISQVLWGLGRIPYIIADLKPLQPLLKAIAEVSTLKFYSPHTISLVLSSLVALNIDIGDNDINLLLKTATEMMSHTPSSLVSVLYSASILSPSSGLILRPLVIQATNLPLSSRNAITLLWSSLILEFDLKDLRKVLLDRICSEEITQVDASMLRQVNFFTPCLHLLGALQLRGKCVPSHTQFRVLQCFTRLGLNPLLEFQLECGLSVDVLITFRGQKVICEVDGPSHYLTPLSRSELPRINGKTHLRNKILGQQFPYITIAYYLWDSLSSFEEEELFLLAQLADLRL